MTLEELYGPLCGIKTQERFNSFFENCVNQAMNNFNCSKETALKNEEDNILYYAGHCNDEIFARIKQFLKTLPIEQKKYESYVNCPACGKSVGIILKPSDDILKEIFTRMDNILKIGKTNHFEGESHCECGNHLFISLYITEKNND